MLTLLALGLVFVVSLLLAAGFLKAGARLVKASRTNYSLALVCMLAIAVGNAAVGVFSIYLPGWLNPGDHSLEMAISLAALAGQLALASLLIRWFLGTTFLRGCLAFIVAMLSTGLTLAFAFLVFRPYVAEAFIQSTNSMAPTLLGWHREGICPHCGGTTIVGASAPNEPVQRPADEWEPVGMCLTCKKAGKVKSLQPRVCPPDGFMVSKFQSPRRWDMVMFRSPKNPELRYVNRLVGLPGEEVFLEDGGVWINGVRISSPPELAALEYVTVVSHDMPINVGTRGEPIHLKEGECCLLGDFSMESADSRFRGPVPMANIEGVVAFCYQPLSRLHLWR
jgi:signal peptidase I